MLFFWRIYCYLRTTAEQSPSLFTKAAKKISAHLSAAVHSGRGRARPAVTPALMDGAWTAESRTSTLVFEDCHCFNVNHLGCLKRRPHQNARCGENILRTSGLPASATRATRTKRVQLWIVRLVCDMESVR